MAKQPETLDRYRIHADNIPMEGLGVVLAALARLGYTQVGYELITDILAYKAPPRVFDVESINVARTFIKQHHSFKARELTTVFEQEGRSSASGFSVIKKLVELGELRKLGGGHYQSTDVKALEAPQPAEEEPAKPNGKHHARYPTSNIVLIWNAVERRKMTTRAEMIQILVDNDRPKTSVNGITAKLTESGRLKPLGEGKYEVIKPKSAKDSKNG